MMLAIKGAHVYAGSFRFDSDTSSGSFTLDNLSDNRTKHSFGQAAVIIIAIAIALQATSLETPPSGLRKQPGLEKGDPFDAKSSLHCLPFGTTHRWIPLR